MNNSTVLIENSLKEEIRRSMNSLAEENTVEEANQLIHHLRDTWDFMMRIKKETESE